LVTNPALLKGQLENRKGVAWDFSSLKLIVLDEVDELMNQAANH
jgi:ATP-dependent helicase YprA (DUF1998 family)